MIPVQTDFVIPLTYNGAERAYEGEVRAVNGQLQVYVGSGFVPIQTTAWVDDDNDNDLKTVVEWAKKKMEQELRDVDMEAKYPKLKELKDEYERALEKYKTFETIKESA